MNKPIYNDQAYIAEEFSLSDDHISLSAWIAFFKINSYKLSLIDSSLRMSREELTGFIKSNLLNYTEPPDLLVDTGFFYTQMEN